MSSLYGTTYAIVGRSTAAGDEKALPESADAGGKAKLGKVDL